MPNSNRSKATRKPAKPSPDFPLSIHKGSGYWCKKVRGHVHYFGKVADDPKGQAALLLWLDQKDALLAGREPRAKTDGLVVGELCNQFLTAKELDRDNGELSPRTFLTYYNTCADVCEAFGRNRLVSDITPDDFRKLRTKLAKTRKLVALKNAITRVKVLFKFAFDEGLVVAPPRYGQGFKAPKRDRIAAERQASRAKHGDQMFEAAEIRLMLDALSHNPGLRAMVLLSANCAFGQSDLANLTTRAVDLKTGWVDFGRGKTGVARRIPLWPETIKAIQEWLPVRPTAKDPADAHLLFLTCRGARFLRLNEKGYHIDGIGQEFQKLIRRLGIKRPRLGIYGFRHGFETIAGETGDQVAVDKVMGHKDGSMAATYRERISDDRLRRVVDHVRAWLLASAKPAPNPTATRSRAKQTPRTPKHSQPTKGSSQPRLRVVG